MRRKHTPLGALFVIALVAIATPVWAEKFEVQADKKSEVVFDSHAPLEKFQGKTNQVSGWLEVDLTDLNQPVKMEIEVDLATFDTGKGKRNKHMRENHLETEKFPLAVFKGGTLSNLSATSLSRGENTEFDLTGTLSLHGVDREMTCHIKLSQLENGDLQVEAKFEVLLPDYKIKRPKFLIVKLAEDQKVTASLLLKKES